MSLEEVLSIEKDAISRQGSRDALETLASSLEKLELGFAPDFVKHLQGLQAIPSFYGELPPFPTKPVDPYAAASASGDLPTHDAVIEYEDDIMFYRKECAEFAKALAKACHAYSAKL